MKSGLDKKDPRFKTLAEDLIKIVNASDFAQVNQDSLDVYGALKVGNLGLDVEFNPPQLSYLQKTYDRMEKEQADRKDSKLLTNANIQANLESLGVKDL